MAAEEEVYRQRLLAKEASLRSLSKKYLNFAAAIEKAPLDQCELLHEELLKELAAYEFGMHKAHCLIETNTQQVADYDLMHRGIEDDMRSTQGQIDSLAVQLKEERLARHQKEQYAVLAKRIHQLPPREETQRNLVTLEEEVASLHAEGEAVGAKLELRSKCFAGFMHALHDLQQQLAEEQNGSSILS